MNPRCPVYPQLYRGWAGDQEPSRALLRCRLPLALKKAGVEQTGDEGKSRISAIMPKNMKISLYASINVFRRKDSPIFSLYLRQLVRP